MNQERYLCLLRGINVSGQRKISMAALRDIFTSMGCDAVQTYLQSGNVLFEAAFDSARKGAIASTLQQETGHDIKVLLYSKAQYEKIIEADPYAQDARIDPKWRHVTFLEKSTPSTPPENHIQLANGDQARLAGGHYFVYCPHGYGRTKLNNRFFEQQTGLAATTRNWKTVSKLKEMLNNPC